MECNFRVFNLIGVSIFNCLADKEFASRKVTHRSYTLLAKVAEQAGTPKAPDVSVTRRQRFRLELLFIPFLSPSATHKPKPQHTVTITCRYFDFRALKIKCE